MSAIRWGFFCVCVGVCVCVCVCVCGAGGPGRGQGVLSWCLAHAGSLAGCVQGGLWQLALHGLSLAAAAPGKAGRRRAEVFGDESGEAWRPLAAACLTL